MHAAAPSASVRPAAVVTDEARRNSGRRRQMVERVQPDARDRFDSSASPGEECVERVIEDKKRCERSRRCSALAALQSLDNPVNTAKLLNRCRQPRFKDADDAPDSSRSSTQGMPRSRKSCSHHLRERPTLEVGALNGRIEDDPRPRRREPHPELDVLYGGNGVPVFVKAT